MKKTHGFNTKNSRIYVIWANMKRRCLKPVGKEKTIYKDVSLCDEWHKFEPFLNWMISSGYNDDLTIDRIDSFKGYSPDNCRLASYSTQSANRKMTAKNQSGFIGVSFESGSWRSKITWEGRQIHLGRFANAEDAAKARDEYITVNALPHTLSSGNVRQNAVEKSL